MMGELNSLGTGSHSRKKGWRGSQGEKGLFEGREEGWRRKVRWRARGALRKKGRGWSEKNCLGWEAESSWELFEVCLHEQGSSGLLSEEGGELFAPKQQSLFGSAASFGFECTANLIFSEKTSYLDRALILLVQRSVTNSGSTVDSQNPRNVVSASGFWSQLPNSVRHFVTSCFLCTEPVGLFIL